MSLLLAALLACPAATDIFVPGNFLTIQDAVDAAGPNDVVVVTGVHFENVVVTTNGLTLSGKGATIDAEFGGPCVTVAADNVTIDGFTLANGGDQVNVADAVSFTGDGATVTNVTLMSAAGIGIRVDGNNALIENCDISSCVDAAVRLFTPDATSLSYVEKNDITGCGRGIAGTGGAFRVMNNKIESISGIGIELTTSSSNTATRVRSNRVEQTTSHGIDISASGGAATELYFNRVEVAGGAGVFVESDSGQLDIVRTTITSAALGGIDAASNGTFFVADNNVRDSGIDGILIAAPAAAGGVVEDNRVTQAAANGIVIEGFGVTVLANTIKDTAAAGIFYNGSNAKLERNKITGAGRQGLKLVGNNGTLEKNKVSRSAFDGILVSGTSNTIVDNRSMHNGGDGIDLHEPNFVVTNKDNAIVGNKVSNNAHEGIDATGIDTVIDENKVTKNGGSAGPQVAGAGNDVNGDDIPDGTVASFEGNVIPTSGTAAPGDAITGQRLDIGEK